MSNPSLIQRRPAEATTAFVAAVSFLLSRIFEWDAEVTSAVTVVIGFIPALVSSAVDYHRNQPPIP